ncbi:hypothetical protein CEXT_115141 [Caerostris extrusa]|uniref:Uncharacterized protein n=1 Tax=Caerostris extrusa TaxID=172846 RepID=A0AAV4RAS7_CAEEX|nr:hypothetical protein CEXT_115141 [Caerostris extrusa]
MLTGIGSGGSRIAFSYLIINLDNSLAHWSLEMILLTPVLSKILDSDSTSLMASLLFPPSNTLYVPDLDDNLLYGRLHKIEESMKVFRTKLDESLQRRLGYFNGVQLKTESDNRTWV